MSDDRSNNLRAEKSVEQYDRWYSGSGGGDFYAAYDRPYWDSHYYPLYVAVLDEVLRLGARRVLEVGCGSGSFGHMLLQRTSIDYHGFDFSAAAIEKARTRTGQPERFSVARAAEGSGPLVDYDAVVCLEVLEHIENDLDVVKGWKHGCLCVCSVPNFDQPDHVRFFRHEDEVRGRYGSLIDCDTVRRIPRALVRGRGWREYFRQLRWSREEPKRLAAMLGYKTFDNLAGWFVFSGRRRGADSVR
jgi:2-polyprenyl-3-methyl-5-hydroxy-6-metoxy-1,4-benzoquinol methylase